MVPETRRSFLRLCAGGIAVAMAGCNGSGGESSAPPGASVPDAEDVMTDPPTYVTRVAVDLNRGESLVSYGSDGEDDSSDPVPYINSEEDAESLQFNPRPPAHEEIRTFLRETDYDTELVVIDDREVRACYRYALQYVELGSGDGVSVQFCQVFRDPSVACSVDERHRQLTLVRVPVGNDRRPSSYQIGYSSSCRLPPEHPASSRGNDE